ncbi:MAG TPA: glycosyltransferase [Thermoanaerobaculia bacterium]|nr:glycosyltransferase [Thermoanaerobaculia bacterium]
MLSIVIPAFNEEAVIGDTVADVQKHFRPDELIVVSDGSTDRTDEIAANRGARVIRLPQNRGKGAAVRQGILDARGDVIAFIDADMPYRPENLERAIELVRTNAADLAIGARDLPESESDPSYPTRRKLAGRTLSLLIRVFLMRDITDTQCGLKAFRGDVARQLFSDSRIDGFGFDFEVLFLAHRRGLRIARVPVNLSHRHASRVRLVRDSLIMLRDLLRARFSPQRGRRD